MRDLLKLLPIFVVALLAQCWFNFFNVTFWLSRLKAGSYRIPLVGWTFETWWGFTMGIWSFNAVFCYIWSTVLIAWCYKESVKQSQGLYAALLIIQIASNLSSILFMRLIAGEVPNRNGWIAIGLFLLASFFTANSGRNV